MTATLRRLASGVVVALAFLAFPPAFAGEVYKCKGANGEITFTNIKCPEKSSVQHYATFAPAPDSPDQSIAAEEAADRIHAEEAQAQTQAEAEAPSVKPNAEHSNIVSCTRLDGAVYYRRGTCGTSYEGTGVTVQDKAEHVSKTDGCSGAKQTASDVRSAGGSFDARSKADARVWDLCNRSADSTRKP